MIIVYKLRSCDQWHIALQKLVKILIQKTFLNYTTTNSKSHFLFVLPDYKWQFEST